MIPDAALGQPYTPTLLLTDEHGSPITAGVGATLALAGPTGATLASAPLVHVGGGHWGARFAGGLLALPGTYRYTATGLGAEGTTLGPQSGTFTVGVVPPGIVTLRELLVDLAYALGDGEASVSTAAGSRTTLVDDRWAYGREGNWVGSELLLLEPINPADRNPVRVIGFDPATGRFEFRPALSASVGPGVDYLIGNVLGAGVPHARRLAAIRWALARAGAEREVEAEVASAAMPTTAAYAIPADWSGLHSVSYIWGADDLWLPVARAYWEVDRERRLLRLPWWHGTGYRVRLRGLAPVPTPRALTALLPVDSAWLRDMALLDLKRNRGRPEDMQQVAVLLNDSRLRATGQRPPANLVRL